MSSIFYSKGPREVWTSEKGSMASETARTRWPKIVQGMIDDVQRTVEERETSRQAQGGRQILELLKQLKSQIENDAVLVPLTTDGSPEIESYNTSLASFGKTSWHDCPWLFAECYLYRRVNIIFKSFPTWADYDVFARQKQDTFTASSAAVHELSSRYMSLRASNTAHNTDDPSAARLLFAEMTEVALWGNATDLSLLSQLSLEQIQSLQGAQAIKAGQARIVSNDTGAAYEYLCENRGRDVDVVLDNAGFEFFTDLVYALYLLDAGLASSVRLHVKSMPWFVSDVTTRDVDVLFAAARGMGDQVAALIDVLKGEFDSGRIAVREHRFWTTGFDFHEMPAVAPDLYRALKASGLVVFKGDLNYRKLVRDAAWPHSTPFKTALGPLAGGGEPGKTACTNGDAQGMRILALRTNKADVCVGVDEETLARLESEAPGKAWLRSGKYAVVSFSDGL